MTKEIFAIAAAIISYEGKYLISNRTEPQHLAGYWEFPGGKVEEGEDPESAVLRELCEETGIKATIQNLFQIVEHEYPERKVKIYFYQCEPTSTPLSFPENKHLKWIPADEFPFYEFAPATQPVIQALFRSMEME